METDCACWEVGGAGLLTHPLAFSFYYWAYPRQPSPSDLVDGEGGLSCLLYGGPGMPAGWWPIQALCHIYRGRADLNLIEGIRLPSLFWAERQPPNLLICYVYAEDCRRNYYSSKWGGMFCGGREEEHFSFQTEDLTCCVQTAGHGVGRGSGALCHPCGAGMLCHM